MPSERKTRALDPGTRRVFSYLDGELPARERDAFEAEIASDRVLAADVAAWRVLLATLDEVAPFTPSPDFRVRVLASLNARQSWWAWLGDRLRGGSPARVPNVFGALMDEGLTTRQARALTAFVARDPEAAAALARWRSLYRELEILPGFAPSEGFADRVMARVRVRGRQRVMRPGVVRSGAGLPGLPVATRHWALARNWIGERWPSPRDRLAAMSGLAVGPVAALLVTLHMLSGNPLLTTSNVASFLRTRAGATMSRLADTLFGSPSAHPAMGRIAGILDGSALSGLTLAAGLVVFGVLTLTSAWILYTNVIKVSRSENRRVPV